MNKVHDATKEYLKDDIPEFDTGDTLIVSVLVREGNKERVQNFEGVVIGRRAGKSLDATFTVRKISNGIGVERIFPLHSPMISNIDVKRKGTTTKVTLGKKKIFNVGSICAKDVGEVPNESITNIAGLA